MMIDIPDALMAAVDETAHAQGKTARDLICECIMELVCGCPTITAPLGEGETGDGEQE